MVVRGEEWWDGNENYLEEEEGKKYSYRKNDVSKKYEVSCNVSEAETKCSKVIIITAFKFRSKIVNTYFPRSLIDKRKRYH